VIRPTQGPPNSVAAATMAPRTSMITPGATVNGAARVNSTAATMKIALTKGLKRAQTAGGSTVSTAMKTAARVHRAASVPARPIIGCENSMAAYPR